MHVYYGYVFAARCTPKVLSQWLRKNESEAQSGNDLFYETGGWWEGRGPLFTICRSLGEIRPDLNKQYAAGAARTRYVGQPASGQEGIRGRVYGGVYLSNICQLLSCAHTRKYL